MKFIPHVSMTKIFLATLIGIVCLGGYEYHAYTGFIADFASDMRIGTLAENKNKYSFLYYYAQYYGQLRLNPETGLYDLHLATEQYRNSSSRNDFELGKLNYHEGDFAVAVSNIESDIRKSGESEEKLFWLAMSYLRQGERENCLSMLTAARERPDMHLADMHAHYDLSGSCSLPVRIFQDKARESEMAGKLFEKLLDQYDAKNRLYQWLLNFSYMTINRFPQDVPSRYLISGEFIDSFYGRKATEVASRYSDLSFTERARELGVDTLDAGKGVAVEDFDGDGYLDIVTCGTFSPCVFYANDHGLRFIDKSIDAGVNKFTQGYMISGADYDNDGRMDLFLSRPFQRFALLRNDGSAHFTDVTFSAGLLSKEPAPNEAVYTCVSAWSDVNNDGYLDLFIAQFGQRIPGTSGLLARQPMSSRLYINDRGHFIDKTDEFGLKPTVEDNIYIGATFGDYDHDGWPDLFLSSVSRNKSVLLKNIGGKRFERTSLIDASEPGFTAAFVDVNQDGQLDLFQGSVGNAKGDTARSVFGENVTRNRNKIFIQQQGRFQVRSDLFEGQMSLGTMGTSFGDLNNDGCPDFYLGTGTPEGWYVLPHLMYLGQTRNKECTGQLTNISMLDGFGTIQKGHGIVFFDFDKDGDQDVYSSLGGMWPGDAWPNQFFVNESHLMNSWLQIRLRGHETNYFGVGARIKVVAENANHQEIVRYAQMDNGTGFGSAPYLAHIGLIDATRIKQVQVYWPASRQTKSYRATLGKANLLDEDEIDTLWVRQGYLL